MARKESNKCKWSRWTRLCLIVMGIIVVCLAVWFVFKGMGKLALMGILFDGLPILVLVAVVWLIGLWVKRVFAKK